MKERSIARLEWADIVRGTATLYIVGFWHIHKYIGNFNIKNIYTRDIALAALALFFFLSGFFLGKTKISNTKDILVFYRKRLKKNYFLYVVSCFSMALIIPSEIHGIKQIGLSLTGLSCLVGPAPDTLWFFSLLLFFYFLTPFILYDEDFNVGIFRILFRICLIYFGIFVFQLIFRCADTRVYYYYPAYFAGLFFSKFNTSISINIGKKLPKIVLVYGICILIRRRFSGGYLETVIIVLCIMAIIYSASCFFSDYIIVRKIAYIVSSGGAVSYFFHRQYYEILYKTSGYFGVLRGFIVYLPLLIVISYLVQRWINYSSTLLTKMKRYSDKRAEELCENIAADNSEFESRE